MYRLAFVDAHHALGDLGEAWQHAAAALAEAGTLDEVYVQVSSLSTSLELVTLLGEQACAGPLRQSLGPDLLRQMPEHANDLWLALAKSALLQHDTAAATQALAQVTGDIGIGRVAVFNRLVGAELALVRGRVQAALALLPAPQAEGMSDESRLRALALRVRACTQAHAALASAMDATLLAECTAALHSEPVHATAALYLHAALAAAAAQGVAGVPATAAADAAAHLARLCESLRAHPAHKSGRCGTWLRRSAVRSALSLQTEAQRRALEPAPRCGPPPGGPPTSAALRRALAPARTPPGSCRPR